ncbi:MAG: PEP/pyruvate-binding domain-containing protein [Desulfobacterales bacterium]|jgi:pyruvate,water dikinase
MVRFFQHLFSRKRDKAAEPNDARQLRVAFKDRYHRFKLLLSANNSTLETMAEIQSALAGNFPFSMRFVRSRCTRTSTQVFQIVRQIDALAPDRYSALFDRFKQIQMAINPHVWPKSDRLGGPLVLPLENIDASRAGQVGPKMANIGEIANRVGLKTPRGFAVTTSGYQQFMTHNDLQPEIDRRIQAADLERLEERFALSSDIQQLIMSAEIPPELQQEIERHHRRLARHEGESFSVAMRSSALGEDVVGASFAGQYRSELNVDPDHIIDAYRQIIASKYGLAAISYRFSRGIRDEDVTMCVGCLRMVPAVSGGVAYSRNPVDFRHEHVLIHSVWGLPKSVVDGTVNPDRFVLSRGPSPEVLEKEIPEKRLKFVCYPEEGVCRLDAVDQESRSASLTDDQAATLAAMAVRLETHYGMPLDIEWALSDEGEFVVLQCRPLERQQSGDSNGEPDLQADGQEILLTGGSTASSGAAAGPVFVVRKNIDALRFPKDAVLVAEQALPRWAPLLDRCAAVVTEQGSMAGHLANVAREFGVPALFGIRGATRLPPEEIVTVDAGRCRIYSGRIDAVLGRKPAARNLMAGSPVYEALRGAAEHIIPLNLLDPDAPSFKADNCRTFHDITRFCHEKAVAEMFRFGRDHHFPERSSKQLIARVPMKWWVLNLDDGFVGEINGPYVNLEQIVSVPMRALWAGITASPWEGPPPVDGRGMMSVLFQATTNQDLILGRRSRFATRNYFMISRNYCSLNSRFGFHFATVETLVSERAAENYISFQFKGGAADLDRKHRRVRFIGTILEDYGFRLDIKEDSLIARLEGRDQSYMEHRLKIVGYLTIHTRQLDMIMANPASVNFYKKKIEDELDRLFPL